MSGGLAGCLSLGDLLILRSFEDHLRIIRGGGSGFTRVHPRHVWFDGGLDLAFQKKRVSRRPAGQAWLGHQWSGLVLICNLPIHHTYVVLIFVLYFASKGGAGDRMLSMSFASRCSRLSALDCCLVLAAMPTRTQRLSLDAVCELSVRTVCSWRNTV